MEAQPPQTQGPIGQVVNGYRIIKFISKGTYGETYLVEKVSDVAKRYVMKV